MADKGGNEGVILGISSYAQLVQNVEACEKGSCREQRDPGCADVLLAVIEHGPLSAQTLELVLDLFGYWKLLQLLKSVCQRILKRVRQDGNIYIQIE